MGRFLVHLSAVVSTTVEVEAEDGASAVETAIDNGVPGLMFLDHTYPDEGEWTVPSELFPGVRKPENDYEEIDSDD